ncbi:hypothetical protein V5F77_15305 [Xanthobacter sp. DSM 24535]|uniref:hypothetical protein n=1 Tax=Roseixanthobacter psychrophilus TaxID=3119917 RepID=UPI0037265069
MPRIPPPTAGLARALYEAGTPIRQIAAETGLCLSAVYFWADRIVEKDGTVHRAPAPRRYLSHPTRSPNQTRRRAMLARLWHAAERQMDEIDARVEALDAAQTPAPPGAARDSEKDAKALAVLARVVRELGTLENIDTAAAKAGGQKGGSAAQQEEGARGRDLDTFRRELARRIDRLRPGGNGDAPAG